MNSKRRKSSAPPVVRSNLASSHPPSLAPGHGLRHFSSRLAWPTVTASVDLSGTLPVPQSKSFCSLQ